jgi:hypothetical protein
LNNGVAATVARTVLSPANARAVRELNTVRVKVRRKNISLILARTIAKIVEIQQSMPAPLPSGHRSPIKPRQNRSHSRSRGTTSLSEQETIVWPHKQ